MTSNKVKTLIVGLLAFLSLGSVFLLTKQPPLQRQTITPADVGQHKNETTHPGAEPKAEVIGDRSNPKEDPSNKISPNLNLVDAFEELNLPKVGTLAPPFKVLDAGGKTLSLEQFKKKSHLVLVFYQGYFCPVCGHQLEGFQAQLDAVKAEQATVLAISADNVPHAQQTVSEHGLSFSVIPDPKHELIELFGVANRAKSNIAWPSVLVLSKEGRVAMAFADKSGKRLTVEEVLPVLKKLNAK
jgi:peroxiredoxin